MLGSWHVSAPSSLRSLSRHRRCLAMSTTRRVHGCVSVLLEYVCLLVPNTQRKDASRHAFQIRRLPIPDWLGLVCLWQVQLVRPLLSIQLLIFPSSRPACFSFPGLSLTFLGRLWDVSSRLCKIYTTDHACRAPTASRAPA